MQEQFNALSQVQKDYLKGLVSSLITKATDSSQVAEMVRAYFLDNKPGFQWAKVTQYTQATVWALEEEGKLIRSNQGRTLSPA